LCLNIYNVIPDDHKFLYSDIINNYGSDLLWLNQEYWYWLI
jgi:hypothetical protein